MKQLIIFIFSLFLMHPISATKVDSLLHELEQVEPTTGYEKSYQIHYELAVVFAAQNNEDYEKATHHFNQALEIADKHKRNYWKADCLFGIGHAYQRMNNFQEALEAYSEIFEIDNVERKDSKIKNAHTQIASIYQALGVYDKAYENQMEALLISEKQNDSLGIANSYYNIGTIFFYQDQYEKALSYYEKTKSIVEELDQQQYIYSSLAALGSVYSKLGDQKESLQYNQRSLELAEKLNYKTGIAYALGNIGENYTSQGKYIQAEEVLKKSIRLKLELKDRWGVIGNQIDLTKLYLKWGKPQLAIPILKEALEISKSVNAKSRQSDIYKNMADVYDQLNQPIKAYYFVKKHIALKDAVLNEKTVEEMGKSKRRFEVRKKEHEIEILKKENLILAKNEEIKNQQFYIFVIATIAFVMFIWWYKSKLKYQNKVNKLLEEKNSLLNHKNEEIHIKNKQLEYSNEDLQQFAYVASHDLKEPLRMINSYTNLLQRRYSASFDESGKEFMHYIIDAVSRMGTLLDDLLDFSRAGAQKTAAEFLDVNNVLVMVEANLRHRLESLNGSLIINNSNFPMVKAHRTQLLQLLQNLVSNGVKFKGERDPVVEISGYESEGNYVFSIKDNGIGISKENLEKVFEMFRRLHTRDEYEGTGIGLATCKRIVATWGGDIWVESVEGEGSTFFFSVPKGSIQMNNSKKELEAAFN